MNLSVYTTTENVTRVTQAWNVFVKKISGSELLY